MDPLLLAVLAVFGLTAAALILLLTHSEGAVAARDERSEDAARDEEGPPIDRAERAESTPIRPSE